MTTELWMMHSKDPSVVFMGVLCFPYPEKTKTKTNAQFLYSQGTGFPEEDPPTEILES